MTKLSFPWESLSWFELQEDVSLKIWPIFRIRRFWFCWTIHTQTIIRCSRKNSTQVEAIFTFFFSRRKVILSQLAFTEINLCLSHGYRELRLGRWCIIKSYFNVSYMCARFPLVNKIRDSTSWNRHDRVRLRGLGGGKSRRRGKTQVAAVAANQVQAGTTLHFFLVRHGGDARRRAKRVRVLVCGWFYLLFRAVSDKNDGASPAKNYLDECTRIRTVPAR